MTQQFPDMLKYFVCCVVCIIQTFTASLCVIALYDQCRVTISVIISDVKRGAGTNIGPVIT